MGDIKVLVIGTSHKPIKIVHESIETDLIKENPIVNIEDLVNQVKPYNSYYVYLVIIQIDK